MSTLSLPLPKNTTEVIPVSRSRSRDSTTGIPNPPRYSTLAGVLPPNLYLSTTNPQTSHSTSQSRPPRYSAVFSKPDDAPRQSGGSRHHSRDSEGRQSDARSRNEQESRNASCTVSSAGVHTFKYYIYNGSKSAAWATLKLYSQASALSSSMNSAGSPIQKVPKFNNNDVIQGSLDLNLSSAQNINSIHLVLRGRIMTSAYDEGICTFLEYPVASWNRADGHPHDNRPTDDSAARKKFEGKLVGDYTWPLNFRFPSEVQLNGSRHAPPTFVDRKSMCSIQYDFVLKISHGLLRSDTRLNVNIAYAPDVMPPPSSILRQFANGECLRAPGPDEDPMGWQTMAPFSLRGKLFGDKAVKLQGTMSLANPQSYVRGSIIPCHISFYSKDSDALEILAQPTNVIVRLARKLQYYEDGGQNVARGSSSNSSRADPKLAEDVSYVGRAVWHTASNNDESNASNPYTRNLDGEIHLDKDLPPSCDFPLFKVSYTVELCSFDLSQLISPSKQSTLGSWPVTIASVHGEGPKPVAFTKPYRSTKKPVKTEYTQYNGFAW